MQKIILSEKERRIIRYVNSDLLSPNIGLFTNSKPENELFNYLINRTWRFGRYYAIREVRQFFRKDLLSGTLFPPISHDSQSYLRNIRSQLVDRGMLYSRVIYQRPRHPSMYVPNIIGCLKALTDIYKPYSRKANVTIILKRAVYVIKMAEKHLALLGVPEIDVQLSEHGKLIKVKEAERMTTIEDQVPIGLEQSEKHKTKRSMKLIITTNDVRNRIRFYCDLCDIDYVESVWTRKQAGSAKNWLRYCKEAGTDPDMLLHRMVKLWSTFRENTIRNDEGQFIKLPSTVSFWKFYIHRQHIEPWLLSEGEVEVIDDDDEIQYRSDYKEVEL